MTVSLCMIVKNEEKVLARCLDSVGDAAEEIIIVDTGSTDGTMEIARRYTGRVYQFPWEDDFSAARNFSFSKAGCDYCLWLDADDVLPKATREGLLSLKKGLADDTAVVMMRYHTAFDEAGRPTLTYYRERLIRRASGLRWEGAVHEAIAPVGRVVYSELAIEHRKNGPGDPDRNLRIFEKLLAEKKALGPREQFYYARELYDHKRYSDAAEAFEAFLDSRRGWVENELDACRLLAYCRYALGQEEAALTALLRGMAYDRPRAELCCDLGRHFQDRGRYRQAVFWYKLALACKPDEASGAFLSPDCYGYLPNLQLCVCYDRLGDRESAKAHNERAGGFKPGDALVEHNRAYFAANP